MSWMRIYAIARKEILQIMRDKRSITLAFLLPITLIFLFGYAVTLDIREIPTVVLDYSNSTHSRELIRSFTNSGYFVIDEYPTSEDRLAELIDLGKARVGLVIPVDFSDQLLSGSAEVQIITDGSDANTSQSVLAYTNLIISDYNLGKAGSLLGSAASLPVQLETRFWYNADLNSQNFLIPGLISLIMTILASLLTALCVAREWERGTMELLISTPIKPIELALGKLLPYYFIGMVDLFLAAYCGVEIFDVPFRGSLWLLALFSTLFLASALSLGYFISVAARSQQLAYQVSMLTSFLPGFLISGFLFPISSMPIVVQYISFLVPARYFIEILRALFLKGVGIDFLYFQSAALLFFALLFSLLAIIKFEKKIG